MAKNGGHSPPCKQPGHRSPQVTLQLRGNGLWISHGPSTQLRSMRWGSLAKCPQVAGNCLHRSATLGGDGGRATVVDLMSSAHAPRPKVAARSNWSVDE